MTKRIFLTLGLGLIAATVIIQCGSSSSTTTATSTQSDSVGAAGAAITAMFSSSSSSSESAAKSDIIGMMFQQALAEAGVAGSNCDEVENDSDGTDITFSNDGTDGTYGPSGDSITVAAGTDDAFCDDGGDISGYLINPESPVEFICTGDVGFFMVGGEGVWRETADGTEVAGTFEIADNEDGTNDDGSDPEEVNCHGTIGDGENSFDMNCLDASGAEVTETSDASCESVEDESSFNQTCESDDDCTQTDLPDGIAFESCNTSQSRCSYTCTTDEQCQELNSSLTCSEEGFCGN